MALQSAVGRGNNPFIGGSKTPNAPPPAMRGSIAPANTGVSSPEGGVAPGQPMFARNNRGSNIGIPYTRLVPLGNARFGLTGTPYTQGSDPSIHDMAYGSGTAGLKKDVITETEDLRATRIGFIHGRRRRAGAGNDNTIGLDAYERGQDVNGIYKNDFQYMLAPGMPGTERFQKLCSLEYLQRYFAHAFKPGVDTITIGSLELPVKMDVNGVPEKDGGGALTDTNQNSWWTSGLLRMVLRHQDTQGFSPEGLLDVLNTAAGGALRGSLHAGDIGDIGKAFGLPDSPMDADYPVLRQGIFVHDTSPFLRGKGITHEMVRCTKYRDAPQKVFDAPGPVERHVQPFSVNRCLGDEVAFDMLERALEDLGVTDWRPDGIVLSKGANDPSDKLSDESFDVRDGQLYNMRIQGPALSTTWTGDPALEVLPLDKVFIVIVADVWFKGLPEGKLTNRLKDAAAGQELNNKVEAVEAEEAAQTTNLNAVKAAAALAMPTLQKALEDANTARRALDPAVPADALQIPAADQNIQDAKDAIDAENQKITDAQTELANAYTVTNAAYTGDAFASPEAYAQAKRQIEQAKRALRNSRKSTDPELDWNNQADVQNAIKALKDMQERGYLAARDAEIQVDMITTATIEEFRREAEEFYKNAGDESKDTVLTNFRVRTATSSQMINYSPLRFDGAGRQDVDTGGTPDQYRKVYYSSRMGLALTDDMGEYIIGGWCIGNVLDTSASRAVMPGAGSNIGVRTAPNSMAHNINVQIEWWDADRMWRSFCNVQSEGDKPTLTPRHQKTWEEPQKGQPTGANDVLRSKDRPPAADDDAALGGGGSGRESLAIKR